VEGCGVSGFVLEDMFRVLVSVLAGVSYATLTEKMLRYICQMKRNVLGKFYILFAPIANGTV